MKAMWIWIILINFTWIFTGEYTNPRDNVFEKVLDYIEKFLKWRW